MVHDPQALQVNSVKAARLRVKYRLDHPRNKVVPRSAPRWDWNV